MEGGRRFVIYEDTTEARQAERELRENEAKYRELVENANSIILRFDTTGRITFFNEFAQMFFGYREDEILGQNILDTIVPQTETSGRNLAAMTRDLLQHPDRYAANENENIRRNRAAEIFTIQLHNFSPAHDGQIYLSNQSTLLL